MLKNINIIATYLVRNDSDILKDSIVHNLNNGVDALIVTEHNSSEESSKILDQFNDYILHRIYENSSGYDQSLWVTNMAKIASKFHPNWIIHCDADELWCGLDTINVDKNVQVIHTDYWYNYLPYSVDEFNIENAKFFEYASDTSVFGRGMQAKRKIVHCPNDNIIIYQGNHACSLSDATIVDTIKIKHYPIRTYEQFKSKVIIGCAAYANSNLPESFGRHWKRWYGDYVNGNLLDTYNSFIKQ